MLFIVSSEILFYVIDSATKFREIMRHINHDGASSDQLALLSGGSDMSWHHLSKLFDIRDEEYIHAGLGGDEASEHRRLLKLAIALAINTVEGDENKYHFRRVYLIL